MTTQTIDPGHYGYRLKVKFPSTYVPEHTPPEFRLADSHPATRTRTVHGEFDLTTALPFDAIRAHFVSKYTEDLLISQNDIEIVEFAISEPSAA